MDDEITGYSDEGEAREGYEPETVYEAHVNANVGIYFMFSCRQDVKRVSVMRSDVPTGIWTNYVLGDTMEIRYHVPLGTWILRWHLGHQSNWLFKYKVSGDLRSPTITKAWGIKREETSAKKAYQEMQEKARANADRRWNETIKRREEVRSKMLQLIDVIFFNRKTKVVDYRKEIVATGIEEAYMLAAQDYGKYNSKVHVRNANCLFNFVEDNEG